MAAGLVAITGGLASADTESGSLGGTIMVSAGASSAQGSDVSGNGGDVLVTGGFAAGAVGGSVQLLSGFSSSTSSVERPLRRESV